MTQLDQSSEFLFCDPSQLRESETNRNYWQVRPTIDRGGEWPGVRERGQPGDHCGRYTKATNYGELRNTVRIESTATYGVGTLVVADFAHGACKAWFLLCLSI